MDEKSLDQCAVDAIADVPIEQLLKESGKLCFLVLLLDQLKQEGHRTLIFSQSVRMLNIIDRVARSRVRKPVNESNVACLWLTQL